MTRKKKLKYHVIQTKNEFLGINLTTGGQRPPPQSQGKPGKGVSKWRETASTAGTWARPRPGRRRRQTPSDAAVASDNAVLKGMCVRTQRGGRPGHRKEENQGRGDALGQGRARPRWARGVTPWEEVVARGPWLTRWGVRWGEGPRWPRRSPLKPQSQTCCRL